MVYSKDNVTYLDDWGQRERNLTGAESQVSIPQVGPISDQNASKEKQSTVSDTEELYPLADLRSPQLRTAFSLLDESSKLITEAISLFNQGDLQESDDCINKIISLLPELFCCRSIGEGYASIIVAINHAIKNKEGDPLNDKELSTLAVVIKRLYTEPFISFNEALSEIIKLEKIGLKVDPSTLSDLMVDASE